MIPPLALELAVVCLGIFLLMMDAFSPQTDKRFFAVTGAAGLLLVLVASFFVGQVPASVEAMGFYVADPAGMFFKRFALVATIFVVLMAADFSPVFSRYVPAARSGAGLGEFFTLPIFACAGLMWMATAADFIMIFVSLELVTVTFYVLVASMRKNKASLEAGVKYLILGALSTGFLVYGVTWIFGMTGQTSLDGIAQVVRELAPEGRIPLLFGFGLVLVALGFKVAAVPFQFWVPDVYQGAPTPVTAYLSVASKAAGFIVLLRVVEPFLGAASMRGEVLLALTVLAGLTLVYGNFAAMPQTNFKRLLAYSSIAHAGYLLMAVASVTVDPGGPSIIGVVGFYLGGYLFATLGAFMVLVLVTRAAGSDEISDFAGLAKRAPFLAVCLLVAMLSLVGLPFTAGFAGKFLVFEAAIGAGQFVLVGIGLVSVACGFYYYLKVVRAMFWQAPPEGSAAIEAPATTRLALWVLSIATIVFGIYPLPLLAQFGR